MTFSADQFDPAYLCFLDEMYHCHWSFRKKKRIQRLRQAIHHFWPDGHSTRFIQVTGTNGKGSVSFHLQQGLGLFGSTGSWTGPHVFDYAERIHINGVPVDHAELVDLFRTEIEPYQLANADKLGDESLGFASLGILVVLKLFERHAIDWGVMEVGAGGRYTPLMALDVAACVLTNVGNDHPITLGAELWQRAMDKAGIARPQIPFFSSENKKAEPFVAATVKSQKGVYLPVEDRDVKLVADQESPGAPDYLVRNKALSLKLVSHFYPESNFQTVLSAMNTRPTGRFGLDEDHGILVDVSHNPDKIAALAQRLRHEFGGRKFMFLLGLTRQRNPREVFAPLQDLAARVVTTSAGYAGQDPHELAENLRPLFTDVVAEPDPKTALELLFGKRENEELIVLTGSAYMIDQALNPNPFLAYMNANFGWRGPSHESR